MSNMLDKLLGLFRNTLDAEFRVAGSLDSPPGLKCIEEVERRLKFNFPPDYRDLVSVAGGLSIEVVESAWPRPAPKALVPAWHFKYQLVLLGVGDGIPDFLNVEKEAVLWRNACADLKLPDIVPLMTWPDTGIGHFVDGGGDMFEWSGDVPWEVRALNCSFWDAFEANVVQLSEYKKEMG